MSQKPQAPDWAAIIAQIVASGMSETQIAKHPGITLSLRAVRYLQRGVQPIYYRGASLLVLWCERTGQSSHLAPVCDVERGHRKAREAADRSPQLQELPNWPPPIQRTEMQGRGRRKKVKEAA